MRHGHQAGMAEVGISDPLGCEQMGHQLPGMRCVDGHTRPAMRAGLKALLQEYWERSPRPLARSIVPALGAPAIGTAGPRSAPKIGQRRSRNRDKRIRSS